MVVNVVTVHVKAEHVQDFIAATLENHRGSRAEPGYYIEVLPCPASPHAT